MVLSNKATPIEYGKFRQAVVDGEVPVNDEVSKAMNLIDFLIDSPEFYYDDQAIKGFVNFCENEMTLTDGSDVRLLPSFKLWAEDYLAWFYFPEEKFFNQRTREYEMRIVKRRLRNKQYLIVGRGAAKSMYSAFMQAYQLVVDPSTTHQIVTAPTMKQANETMAPIQTAIARARGPFLRFLTEGDTHSRTWTRTNLASTKKGIENFATNSIIEVRPMSVDKLQGLRSKMNSVDEWLSGRVKEDVIGAIEQGASKIDDWGIIATSSEGTARNGVGDTIKMGLEDILDGKVVDWHTSIWYYKLDNLKEVNDPYFWPKANPNIGATVSYDAYQRDVELAENQPSKRNDILAKRFGIPVEGFTYFFTYEETIPHKSINMDGRICTVGADLSQGDDFNAFTFLFPLEQQQFGVKTRAYVSEAKVNRLPKAMQIKYDEMSKEGTLVILPGNILDQKQVNDDLFKFIEDHNYQPLGMGFDKYNSQQFTEAWSMTYGSFGMEAVVQGARTESVPMGELKNLSESRSLIFDEKLMEFAMGNAVAIQDNNGNLKLSKMRSEEKIDNVAALIDAWVAYKRNQEAFM